MSRLFVAIDFPERIKDDISSTYMAIPGAKWVDDAQLHLTLRFIGDVDPINSEKVIRALSSAVTASFNLILQGVGHFPPRREPKILWVGVSKCTELLRLQNKIERAIISTGIAPDTRKFHPHITVARLNGSPAEKVAQFLAGNSLFKTEQFEVSQFHLYNSHLRKEGAYHEKIASYKLD